MRLFVLLLIVATFLLGIAERDCTAAVIVAMVFSPVFFEKTKEGDR